MSTWLQTKILSKFICGFVLLFLSIVYLDQIGTQVKVILQFPLILLFITALSTLHSLGFNEMWVPQCPCNLIAWQTIMQSISPIFHCHTHVTLSLLITYWLHKASVNARHRRQEWIIDQYFLFVSPEFIAASIMISLIKSLIGVPNCHCNLPLICHVIDCTDTMKQQHRMCIPRLQTVWNRHSSCSLHNQGPFSIYLRSCLRQCLSKWETVLLDIV